jgi:hypothetical protein
MSQNDIILHHLQSGRALTPLQALSLCGCLRLSARIHDLRHDGHIINSRLVKINSSTTVAEYRMAPR